MKTATLETPRLLLRPVAATDFDFLYRLFTRPETRQYGGYEDLGDLEEEKLRFEDSLKFGSAGRLRLIVELKEESIPVGTVCLFNCSERDRRAELGYDMLKEYWGRGIMTEAVCELIRYGFEDLGLNRVEASVNPENTRSVRLLQRTGFSLEGRLRGRNIQGGQPHDDCLFGLLRKDWRTGHVSPPST